MSKDPEGEQPQKDKKPFRGKGRPRGNAREAKKPANIEQKPALKMGAIDEFPVLAYSASGSPNLPEFKRLIISYVGKTYGNLTSIFKDEKYPEIPNPNYPNYETIKAGTYSLYGPMKYNENSMMKLPGNDRPAVSSSSLQSTSESPPVPQKQLSEDQLDDIYNEYISIYKEALKSATKKKERLEEDKPKLYIYSTIFGNLSPHSIDRLKLEA
jgi:hypothetical protein